MIRDQMVLDAADEPDDGIAAFLPGEFAGLEVMLPEQFSLDDALVGSKANLKALGFTDLDSAFGLSDGTIEFNSQFHFDFDNSDGVNGFDFETIAAHEIGHTLGFLSRVDSIDALQTFGDVPPGFGVGLTTLDLFRFGTGAGNPATTSEFSDFAREMTPGMAALFDDLMNEYEMSTGAFSGDGRQASHWKDDLNIGIMDPTLGPGQSFDITAADLRALDVIGYEVATVVPLPSALLLFGSTLGVLLIAPWSRRYIRS